MIGQRSIERAKHGIQKLAFDSLHLSEVVDREEQHVLALAMGFVGQFERHRRFQFEFLKAHGIVQSSRVLEYGPGPLTLGAPLIGYLDKGGYVGVDVRSSVANIAYQQISKFDLAGKNPRIIVSDDFAARELDTAQFDAVWSFSMLFHLSDDLVERLFGVVSKHLAPGARYWANINTEADESTWLEFPFVRRAPAFYERIAQKNDLKMTTLGTLGDLGIGIPDADEAENLLLEFTAL